MKLVDPRKLAALRDVLDGYVSELCVEKNVARREALIRAASELYRKLEYFKIDSWYVASCQMNSVWDEIYLYADNADWDRAGDVDVESRLGCCAIASTPETAAVATLLQALDPSADIFFTEEDAREFYPQDVIDQFDFILFGFETYIRQERWFGDIPQTGRAAESFGILESSDGFRWEDVEDQYVR